MWKGPVLLLFLGSASLWIAAEGAPTAHPEDHIVTTGIEDGMETTGAEDNDVTPGVTEEPNGSTSLHSLVTTSPERITDMHIEDQSTVEGTTQTQEESQITTTMSMVTSHSHSHSHSHPTEKVDEETETIVEKDGLATATLIGIIVGVLLAIGFIGGIIFVVVRKMSGRP
ncbi:podoplanin isoform X2 [Sorex fumeus]|uniref:podoplanin isoform X2 n=1 Tax=Sorex fumeus TaxID=62283 RepID=UPI0024ACB39A|nr:podoplanin isoform X2 [Sorex fumeus]